jgi:hypothetical protein
LKEEGPRKPSSQEPGAGFSPESVGSWSFPLPNGLSLVETIRDWIRMAFCPNCGEKLTESAFFCSNCGKATATALALTVPSPVMKPKKKLVKVVAGIVVALVVSFVVLGVLISYLTNTEIASPTEPVRYADIRVTVSNDDLFGSKSYSIYIDGDLKETDTIGGLATHEFSIGFSWRGAAIHNADVMVFEGGSPHVKVITVEDGGSGHVSFRI